MARGELGGVQPIVLHGLHAHVEGAPSRLGVAQSRRIHAIPPDEALGIVFEGVQRVRVENQRDSGALQQGVHERRGAG